jgi:hypothetical protein
MNMYLCCLRSVGPIRATIIWYDLTRNEHAVLYTGGSIGCTYCAHVTQNGMIAASGRGARLSATSDPHWHLLSWLKSPECQTVNYLIVVHIGGHAPLCAVRTHHSPRLSQMMASRSTVAHLAGAIWHTGRSVTFWCWVLTRLQSAALTSQLHDVRLEIASFHPRLGGSSSSSWHAKCGQLDATACCGPRLGGRASVGVNRCRLVVFLPCGDPGGVTKSTTCTRATRSHNCCGQPNYTHTSTVSIAAVRPFDECSSLSSSWSSSCTPVLPGVEASTCPTMSHTQLNNMRIPYKTCYILNNR